MTTHALAARAAAGGRVASSPLGEDAATDLAKGFAALGDPARLRLLSLIANNPDGAVCACDLVTPLGRSQPTVSHHLKILREAGLVISEKRGVNVWYSASPSATARLQSALALL